MRDPDSTSRSELSGSAGDVVQARDIRGGVHFHQPGPARRTVPRQLPADVRGFVNREVELDRLARFLRDGRQEAHFAPIVVITGTAGVGKTSLAVHWAHRVRDRFTDGQLYLNLRGYDPGEPVAPGAALDLMLGALGLRAGAIPADLQAKATLYRTLLADLRMLVVLDNAATVGQIRPLLPGTASCLVLVTSRNRLPGLVARDGAIRLTVDVLADHEAVTLIRTVIGDYRRGDGPDQLRELARLCARLPLALRIAAERAAARPWMALTELIQDLRDESALWDALSSSDDDEADAVRTVLAWSYRALPRETASLFRRLGLHPGAEFGLGAASALAGHTRTATRQLLAGLQAIHLLDQVGSDRYQLHDLLRAYAIDLLRHEESADEQQMARYRLLTWYLHTADAARRTIVRGNRHLPIMLDPPPLELDLTEFTDHTQAVAWYETNRFNLMAATHTAAQAGLDRIAWQLPAVLGGIYDNRDPADTWLETEQVALAAARRAGDGHGQAVILDRLGIKYRKLRRIDDALGCFNEAMAIFNREKNGLGQARVYNGLGLTYLLAHRLDEARVSFEHGITLVRAEGDETSMRALFTLNLGETYLKLDRPSEALAQITEAVSIFRRFDDQAMESVALRLQGAAQFASEMPAETRISLERALELARAVDSPIAECEVLVELTKLDIAEGAPADALIHAHHAALIASRFSVTTVEASALDLTGTAYQQLGRPSDAVAFHRHAAELHRSIGERREAAAALDHLATALENATYTDEE